MWMVGVFGRHDIIYIRDPVYPIEMIVHIQGNSWNPEQWSKILADATKLYRSNIEKNHGGVNLPMV